MPWGTPGRSSYANTLRLADDDDDDGDDDDDDDDGCDVCDGIEVIVVIQPFQVASSTRP